MGKFLCVATFWLMGLMLQVSAVEIVSGPKVEAGNTTAKITWKTDTECGTRARYGLGPDKLEQKVEGGVSIEHEVLITGLQAGTVYHFNVGTARYVLKTGSFETVSSLGTPAPAPKPVTKAPSPPAASKPAAAAPVSRVAPPTRQTWGNPYSLQDHFDRHGHDFAAKDPDDYARKAWEFFQRALDEGLPAKFDEEDRTFRVYDPKTGAFGAYTDRGRTKTYFKPGSSYYFDRQPGKLVKLHR